MFKHHIAKNPLPVIFFTIFVDLLGFGILIPVIPQLLANPASEYYLLPHGWTPAQGFILLGFLTAVFSIAQFLATPILGQLSDRYGRKKLLAISLFGTCLSYIIFAYGIMTGNLALLFFARALDGVTGGNISIAQAAIADVTTPDKRARNFGLIGAAFGLGFIIGPYIGGKLSDPSVVSWFNATTPFIFAAALSALNVASIILFFPETLTDKNHTLKIKWSRAISNVYHASINKELRVLFGTVFLFTAGFTFFTTFFSVFLIDKFHFTQSNIGDFFAYVGLWVAFTQAVITGRVSAKYPAYKIIRYGILASGIALFLYFLPQYWWQLLFIVPLFAIGNGLMQANITALISRSAGPEIQGEVLGINSSVSALAMSIPPILSGFIAASLTPEAPIFVAGTIVLLAAAFFWIFYKPHQIHEAHADGWDSGH
jgi:MFS transporter, DHA1 family, tetracycline resistance protein